MKILIGDKFKCINKEVLDSYYDSEYNGEVLTVTDTKIPKVRNITGGSSYFAIFTVIDGITKIGHQQRFAISLDKITKENFIRIPV
jgi:hypothetical protein